MNDETPGSDTSSFNVLLYSPFSLPNPSLYRRTLLRSLSSAQPINGQRRLGPAVLPHLRHDGQLIPCLCGPCCQHPAGQGTCWVLAACVVVLRCCRGGVAFDCVSESRVLYTRCPPIIITAALLYSWVLLLHRCSHQPTCKVIKGCQSDVSHSIDAILIRHSTPPPPPPFPPPTPTPIGASLEQRHLPVRPTCLARPPREGCGV